jgi:hypothetical protein
MTSRGLRHRYSANLQMPSDKANNHPNASLRLSDDEGHLPVTITSELRPIIEERFDHSASEFRYNRITTWSKYLAFSIILILIIGEFL